MSIHDLMLVLREHWGIAMMAIYLGIVLWAVRPWARGHYRSMASLPLRDEDPVPGEGARASSLQAAER